MHVYYQKLFFVATISLFVLGCTRSNEGSTKLTIQMPTAESLAAHKAMQTNQSIKASEIVSYSGDVNAYQEWSGVNPTSLAEFNCFMVAAAGPELFLNRNSCGKKLNVAASDPFTPSVSFGPIRGAIPQGTSLEFEVASGSNRIIYLIGFKALTTEACADYKSSAFDQSNLSKPYIIGKSAPVNLTGPEATVNVPMSFDANNWFDECSGPEFDHADDNRMATQIALNKTSYPMYTTVIEECQALDVELHDSLGRPAKSTAAVNVKLDMIGVSVATGEDPATTLFTNENYHDCINGVAGPSSFSIPAGNISVKRWFKSLSSTYSSTKFRVNAGSSLPEQPSDFGIMTLGNLQPSAQQIDLTGPTNVVLNQCYRYEANDRTMGRGYLNGANQTVSIKMPSFAIAYESNSTCAGGISPITSTVTGDTRTVSLVMNNTGSLNRYFYVKYKPSAMTLNKSFQFSAASVGYVESKMNVYVSNSSATTITGLAIREDVSLPNVSGACYGPFHLALVNETKSDIMITAARSINVAGATGKNFTLHQDTCVGSPVTGNISIPAYTSSAIFYITISPSLPNTEQSVEFTDNTTGVTYPFKFYPN